MRFATVTTALATAILGANAQQTRVLVDPSVYDDIVHYARYAAASQPQPCPNPPNGAVVQAYVDVASTDTQATLFRDDARAEFVLAFPGTNGTRDTLTNFAFLPVPYLPLHPGSKKPQCPGCMVHLGFYSAWASAAGAVRAELDAAFAGAAGRENYTLVLGGGSQGAALANLAFASLKAHPAYAASVRAVYNSGQPRVGNRAYADYVDALAGVSAAEPGIFFRSTHADDGVVQLPPRWLGGFRHAGTEYWQSEMEPSAATTYRCFGQEPADCNNAHPGQLVNDAHITYAGYDVSCFDS